MSSTDLAVIVVHHKSYSSLARTLGCLLRDGVLPSQVVIVDNSEEEARRADLESSLHPEMNLIYCSNDGYGAAVNAGVEWHSKNTHSTFTLVSTHESLPEPGSIELLIRALDSNPTAAVAGPTLVTGDESDSIWSLGGYFSRFLGLPRHEGHGRRRSEVELTGVRRVKWVDGAFLLFRREVLEQCPVDERYFLYMEEVDHHLELGRRGWGVLLVAAAVVWQSSAGTPSYYQARNIQLLQARNGTLFQRLLSAPYVVGRGITRELIRKRSSSQVGAFLKGWRDGILVLRRGATPSGASQKAVCVVNPLGGALAHYADALMELLIDAGVEVKCLVLDEPSVSGTSRWRWAREYLRALKRAKSSAARDSNRTVLVTWPVFGFLDLLIVKLLCGKNSAIVYHDPKPLVRSVGSSQLSSRIMSLLPGKPRVIVHSEQARASMESFGLALDLDVVMHPMARPPARPVERHSGAGPTVIRVLGQFKQDRDLGLLGGLAAALDPSYVLEIVGRGWPAVPGWVVDSRFVPEDELTALARTTDVILIPYKRFYQSGIAIRAVEGGTPIVGRAGTSLADVFGASSPLLVKEDSGNHSTQMGSWVDSIQYAVEHGRSDTYEAGNAMYKRAVREWGQWVSSTVKGIAGSRR